MLSVAVLSPGPGSGKTTVLVNLGIGLQRKGYRVLLATGESDCLIRPWLNQIGQKEISQRIIPETTSLNVDLLIKPDNGLFSTYLTELKDLYDYVLVDAGSNQAAVCIDTIAANIIIACVEAGIEDNKIFELDKQIRHISQGARSIDIVVPSKARAGEWENNVHHLMILAEYFGEDRLADFIPFCEAIHDLPREKKAVWDLPQNYSNRKQAFDRLVDKITSPSRIASGWTKLNEANNGFSPSDL